MSIKKMAGNGERGSRHVELLQDDASLSINRLESLSDSARMQGRKKDAGISYRDLKRHNLL